MMKKKMITAAAAVVLTLTLQSSVQAATSFANCTAMHKKYPHGVAKSQAAADREVKDGYGHPKVSLALYRANRKLDANKDGVACEA